MNPQQPGKPGIFRRVGAWLRRGWPVLVAVVLVGGVAGYAFYRRNWNRPVRYAGIQDHFKYGTIGSDNAVRGLPLAIINALPKAFPEYLPPGAPPDYSAFGFLTEPGKPTPIGFSQRRNLVMIGGLNCAVCHTGTVRATPQSQPRIYLGMPAHQIDLNAFFGFLFTAAGDRRFNPDYLMPFVERANPGLGRLEKWLLRTQGVRLLREGLLRQQALIAYQFEAGHTQSGRGRVDTFGGYKVSLFRFPVHELPKEEMVGVADLPSIWDQAQREGMPLHWDGNNPSLMERNFSASFGAGATPATVDIASLERTQAWLRHLPVPRYPFPVDAAKAAAGERVYDRACYGCHGKHDYGPGGRDRRESQVGRIMRLADIGTDPYRNWSFTRDLAVNQATLLAGTRWRLRHFHVTPGYVNQPLDGVWLRAPYLHNGAVPTLYDLLKPAAERPTEFYRGYDVYDQDRVGFVSSVAQEGSRRYFRFEVRDAQGNLVPGNSNLGHEYGTTLGEDEKRQLLEYLKTL